MSVSKNIQNTTNAIPSFAFISLVDQGEMRHAKKATDEKK